MYLLIQCFIIDPDPQLCNISLLTTLPEYKNTVTDHTTVQASSTTLLASTTSTEKNHKDLSNTTMTIPIVGTIAIQTMVVVLVCFASLIMMCFVVR